MCSEPLPVLFTARSLHILSGSYVPEYAVTGIAFPSMSNS